MENPIKIDDLGVQLFLETPIFAIYGNLRGYEAHHLSPNPLIRPVISWGGWVAFGVPGCPYNFHEELLKWVFPKIGVGPPNNEF